MRAEQIGRGGEHVGDAPHQVASTVPVIVDGVLEVIGRHELHLADFTGPGADHIVRREVAVIDEAQRRLQLGAEHLRPAAVIGERRQRSQRAEFTEIGAEVRLQPPETDKDGTGHPEIALDAGKQIGMLFKQLPTLRHAVVGDHAVGEFEEALREHALPAVGVDDPLVVADAVEIAERGGRDSLDGGFLPERREPALEPLSARALLGRGSPGRHESGGCGGDGAPCSRPQNCHARLPKS
jgi:hypothetical protein